MSSSPPNNGGVAPGITANTATPFSLPPPHANSVFAATAAAVAAFAGSGSTMSVFSVPPTVRGRSPIISTANQVNAKTAAKKKSNKQGDLVAAMKGKEQRIFARVHVFSERSTLIKIVKQGDPQYNTISNVARAGFRFYGTVKVGDKKKGYWHVEYDLFPEGAKSLKISRNQCTTLHAGEDEPQYDPRHEKVSEATARLELLESEVEEDFDLVLPDSSDDDDKEGGDASCTVMAKKAKKKK